MTPSARPGHALGRVLGMFERKGFSLRTGLSPYHFRGYRDAPFTALYRDRRILGTGGGIALQEVYFLECLFATYAPRNLFVVGNAFGWSTLLLACLLPEATIVAIDNGGDGPDTRAGIELTNQLAEEEGLNVRVVLGQSPQDVPAIVASRLGEPIDCCLIDGLHTNDQQQLDFEALRPFLAAEHLLLFHDVVNCSLVPSFASIACSAKGVVAKLLMRTPSGMGVLYTAGLDTIVGPVVHMFYEPEWACQHVEALCRGRSGRAA